MSAPARKRLIKIDIEEIQSAMKKEGITLAKIKRVILRLQSKLPKAFRDYVTPEEFFDEFFPGESKPAVMLRGARHKEEYTQEALAEKLGTTQSAIAAMENGSRPIGKDMAHRLSKVLKVHYKLFL